MICYSAVLKQNIQREYKYYFRCWFSTVHWYPRQKCHRKRGRRDAGRSRVTAGINAIGRNRMHSNHNNNIIIVVRNPARDGTGLMRRGGGARDCAYDKLALRSADRLDADDSRRVIVIAFRVAFW